MKTNMSRSLAEDPGANGAAVDRRREVDTMICRDPSREIKAEYSQAASHLKLIIDKMPEELEKSGITISTIEVEGKELSVDECAAKMKVLGERNSGGKTVDGSLNNGQHQAEDTSALLNEYETQIETLKTEIEVLRATLQDASEREQHYKILVGQLDMADSRAQQKWESFHNSVVQQWSNHSQVLQQQLTLTSMKLRQMSIHGSEHVTTKTDGSDSSLTPSVDNLENAGVTAVPTAPPLLDYSDTQQQPIPDMNIPPPGFHPSMQPSMMPGIPLQVPLGQAPTALPRWPVPDNRETSPYSSLPQPPPMDLLHEQPFVSGKMSSARQLHHFFTNLSMIEKAQKEGRAYRNSDQHFQDQETDRHDDSAAGAHIPRRARTFGNGPSAEHDDNYDQEPEVELQPPSLPDAVGVAKPYTLTPTADPFVPENVTGNVEVN